MQETCARVLAKPRLLHRQDDFGYLLRSLRNTYASHLRSQRRRPACVPLTERAERLEDLRRDQDRCVTLMDLRESLSALPTAFRAALVAVDVAGLSYREAARALGVPEGTLMSRLARARRRVVWALEGEAVVE